MTCCEPQTAAVKMLAPEAMNSMERCNYTSTAFSAQPAEEREKRFL